MEVLTAAEDELHEMTVDGTTQIMMSLDVVCWLASGLKCEQFNTHYNPLPPLTPSYRVQDSCTHNL